MTDHASGVAANRALWNAWADLHVASSFYFGDGDPLVFAEKGSYAAPDADFEGESHSWQHTFEDIFSALLGAGLAIEWLREYPRIAWQHFPFLEKDEEGMWRLPSGMPEIPLLFALRARKPE